MNNHTLRMIIGCGLPLLFIFFAPALGINSSISIFIFIIAMFACHLLMPMHSHGGHKHDSPDHSDTSKTINHATHKH